MITANTAALIAQVYPVGILLLGLEARRVRWLRDAEPVTRFFTASYWVLILLAGIAVTVGVASVAICLVAVNLNESLVDVGSWFVGVSGVLLALSVVLFLLYAIGESTGVPAQSEPDPTAEN